MVAHHNAARWLAVRYLHQRGGRGCCPPIIAGWYVVRTCKCHNGTPVTVPLPSSQRAERARAAMLVASRKLGT